MTENDNEKLRKKLKEINERVLSQMDEAQQIHHSTKDLPVLNILKKLKK
jgi:transketolase N-terminal domain/subunit